MPSTTEPPAGPVGVVGSTGRLGSAIVRLCAERGIPVTTTATGKGWSETGPAPVVLIDASRPEALDDTIAYCLRTGCSLLYCASGLTEADRERLAELGEKVAVVIAANLSPLHWVQAQTVRLAARLAGALDLPVEYAVLDRHPVTKRDAPSATATALAGLLPRHEPIVSARHGPPVSDHTVTLSSAAETLELAHTVRDLRPAAAGALALAGLLPDAGLHTAADLYARRAGL